MNNNTKPSSCTTYDVIRLLREGHGIKKVINMLHVGYTNIKVIEALRIMRRGKEPITKADFNKKDKPVNLDKINRATKAGWIKYMMANPIYFTEMMNKEFSRINVLEEADKQFKESICLCCRKVHNFIQCMPEHDYEEQDFYAVSNLHKSRGVRNNLLEQIYT